MKSVIHEAVYNSYSAMTYVIGAHSNFNSDRTPQDLMYRHL